MNKVQKLFSRDIKNQGITPLSDEELTRLLYQAKYGESEAIKKEAKNKIVLHVLPIIISRCKKYFPEDYLIENTDFINEVVLYLLETAIDNYRLDEQEGNRCALFFKQLHFVILFAYKRVKQKQFGTFDVSYKEFLNVKAKEFSEEVKKYNVSDFVEGIEDWWMDDEGLWVDEDGDWDIEENLDFISSTSPFSVLEEKEMFLDIIVNVLPKVELGMNLAYFIERGELMHATFKRSFKNYLK